MQIVSTCKFPITLFLANHWNLGCAIFFACIALSDTFKVLEFTLPNTGVNCRSLV